MHKRRIVFRADGNTKIGFGHIYRCLALIDILAEKFSCCFVVKDTVPALLPVIRGYCPVIELDTSLTEEIQMTALLSKQDIVVLDGYDFSSASQRAFRNAAGALVMIDDYAHNEYVADIIINHGDSSVQKQYKAAPYTKIYTGAKYLILRKQFLDAAGNRRHAGPNDTVYICFGGADPHNNTLKAVQACIAAGFIRKIIIVAGNAAAVPEIEKIAATQQVDIIYRNNIDADQMISLLKEAGIAICTASTVSLEACCIRTGLIAGTIVENQQYIYRQLIENGCAIPVGDINICSAEKITQAIKELKHPGRIELLAEKQAALIDGSSPFNILDIFTRINL